MMLHGSLFFKKTKNLGPNISCFFLTIFLKNSLNCSDVEGSSVGWKAQKGDKNGKIVDFYSDGLPPVTTAVSITVITPIRIAIVSTPTAIIPGFGLSLRVGLRCGLRFGRSLSKVVITVSPGVGVSVISTPSVSVVSKTISVSVGTVSVVSGMSVISVPGISSGISLRVSFSGSSRFSFSIRGPLASVVSVISTVGVSVITSPSTSIVSIPCVSSGISLGFGFGLRLCHYGGNSQSYEK